VLPGPSAVQTALVASGLGTDRYAFIGFLPRRAKELDTLWHDLADWPSPVVAFESPQRLPASLRSLAETMPERQVAVCRELTKRFEEVLVGSATVVADWFTEAPKGEITLVLGARTRGVGSARLVEARRAVAELVAAGTPRRVAADVVARLTDTSKNDLYQSSL
jgi:16S rRNA (cytidine1402-2'-O)-methyltransferase